MKKKSNLKSQLFDLEKEELIQVIIEISKLDSKNKDFLEIFLKSSDEIDFEGIINIAKQKIFRFIYGTPATGRNSLKLRDAKKVISEAAKLLKEYPVHIADLKLYYVEICNEFTQEFGDISEPFYNSIISTYDDFGIFVIKHPLLYDIFKVRLDELYKKSRNIGWGYSDDMEGLYYRLKIEFDKESLQA